MDFKINEFIINTSDNNNDNFLTLFNFWLLHVPHFFWMFLSTSIFLNIEYYFLVD